MKIIKVNQSEMMLERLKWMNFVGLNPRNQTSFRICVARFWLAIIFILLCFEIAFIFTTKYQKLSNIFIDIVIVIGNWQIFYKIYTCNSKNNTLLNLVDTMFNKFWSTESLSKAQNANIEQIIRYSISSAYIFNYSLTVTLCTYFISSYFKDDYNLILNIWVPNREFIEKSPNYEIVFITEAIVMSIVTLSAYSEIDMMFVVIVGTVLSQFKILKYTLNKIGTSDNIGNFEILRKCVEHHNMLLGYLKQFEYFFSYLMFHVLGSNVILSVMTLFCILVEDNLSIIITLLLICFAVNLQLFVFCFCGQLIKDEAQTVGNAAYDCNWENIPDRNIRFGLILIIRQSQNPVNITMGGFMILCLESFTRITKMMFSCLTFMINFKGEQ